MMKRYMYLAMVFALLLAIPVTAQADRILYWADYSVGPDLMDEALTNLSGVHTVVRAADEADFEAKVAAGGWDLVILAIQNSGRTLPNFTAYVEDLGGRAIFQDWTANAGYGSLFGVTYTGNFNMSPVTISNAQLASGVSNPLDIINTGWGIFSMGMTATTGTVAATFPFTLPGGAPTAVGDAAIVISPNGRGIINGFLTDTPSPAADGVRLYENEIGYLLGTLKPVMLLTPNGGETLKKGSTFMVTWTSDGVTEPVFTTRLQYNCGGGWTTFALIGGNPGSYGWAVPKKFKGGSACKAKVHLRGIGGRKIAGDTSDSTFSIQ